MIKTFIYLQEDILPMILQNNMGHVIKGQMLQLTSELLSAKVMDTMNAPSNDIIFTLSPPVNNPKEGLHVLLFYLCHCRENELSFIFLLLQRHETYYW